MPRCVAGGGALQLREAVLAEQALVRICDLAGRTRGTGFVADGTGTVVTSHEAVDGLARVVVHARGRPGLLVEDDGITSLPEWDLALIRTDGLGIAPLLIGADRAGAPGTSGIPVRIFTGREDGRYGDGHEGGGREDGRYGDGHEDGRYGEGCDDGGHDGGHEGGEGQGAAREDGGWTRATLAGASATVTYTSTTRFQDLEGALELRLPEGAHVRLRLDGPASGSPVLDAVTGAVLAVVGTALHAPGGCDRRAGFAVPLRTAGLWDVEGRLAATLARNGATVPGTGPDLNLAGALRLTATTVRPALERAAATASRHVDRPEVAGALREFSGSDASVTALVGRPGTGRTTRLAALAAERAAERAAESEPAPTIWLRGAQLREGDGSVREAVGRALTAEAPPARHPAGGTDESTCADESGSRAESPCADASSLADVVARLAREARRPLLVLLDAPEEMPARLSRDLRRWTAGTAGWLRAAGARMIVACGPEQWEQLGPLMPAGLLYDGPGTRLAAGARRADDAPRGLPPCVLLPELAAAEAAHARALYGLGADDLAAPDAGHPLTMRMLAEIRADQNDRHEPNDDDEHSDREDQNDRGGQQDREDQNDRDDQHDRGDHRHRGRPDHEGDRTGPFDRVGLVGRVDLVEGCGQAAVGVAAPAGDCRPPGHSPQPPRPRQPLGRDAVFAAYLDLTALRIARELPAAAPPVVLRRLAVRTAGALHEAARRSLGPVGGSLGRYDFEEVFPRAGGWAEAVLSVGVLEAAGDGFRFADEEFGDWLQGRHLDVDAALAALVHGRGHATDGAGGAAAAEPRIPRRRIGPVVHALVLCETLEGADALDRRLRPLADVIASAGSSPAGPEDPCGEAVWWAGRLLRDTLLRVPDARPYYGLLRGLAEHFGTRVRGAAGELGPSFWRRLALPAPQRIGLLRLLLPADAPPAGGRSGKQPEERYIDVVGELLAAEPETVLPLLCGWFTDRRPLTERAASEGASGSGGCSGTGSGSVPARDDQYDRDGQDDRDGQREAGLPRPTVASAAQALLYAHGRRAGDLMLDLLTDACHPRADELLGELAQEEPSALCRAVERWANHAATLRQIAAAEYGPRLARRARSQADRRHLERAAHALLRIPGGSALHAPSAMAMLLRLRQGSQSSASPSVSPTASRSVSPPANPLAHPVAHPAPPEGGPSAEQGASEPGASAASAERDRDLDAALGLLAATGSAELADALAGEVCDRPAPALAAFRSYLCDRPGGGAHHLTGVLARVRRADLAVPVAEVVREYAEIRPETAAEALATFVRGRLAHRPRECCPGLQLLTDALLCTPYAPLRAGLARALGALEGPVAEELLSVLLVGERDPAVLDAALEASGHRRRAAAREATGAQGANAAGPSAAVPGTAPGTATDAGPHAPGSAGPTAPASAGPTAPTALTAPVAAEPTAPGTRGAAGARVPCVSR
nr:hypothetical protein [Streptomyces sp. HNM0575]